jgi:hypothetical protein
MRLKSSRVHKAGYFTKVSLHFVVDVQLSEPLTWRTYLRSLLAF